jgi:hypothetical protein
MPEYSDSQLRRGMSRPIRSWQNGSTRPLRTKPLPLAGRGGGGGAGTEGAFFTTQDTGHPLHDAFRIPHDLVVPEPQHREVVPMQMGVACFIGMSAGLPVVLAAIDLDHEPGGQTRQVDDQVVDRSLPTKRFSDASHPRPHPTPPRLASLADPPRQGEGNLRPAQEPARAPAVSKMPSLVLVRRRTIRVDRSGFVLPFSYDRIGRDNTSPYFRIGVLRGSTCSR